MSAARRRPVSTGYMPKGGPAAALASNAQHVASLADRRSNTEQSGSAACAGLRALPDRLVAVACWAVIAASGGAVAAEAGLLWLIVNG